MSKFTDYVTSAAFRLDLSKNMIEYMLAQELNIHGFYDQRHWYNAMEACGRRGLIEIKVVNDKGHRSHKVTKEGKLVIELLKLSGFSIDKSKIVKIA